MNTNVMTRQKIALEDMSQNINKMLGNQFAMPKVEVHECHFCEFEGAHIVELYLADLKSAKKQFRCTKCGQVWIYKDAID